MRSVPSGLKGKESSDNLPSTFLSIQENNAVTRASFAPVRISSREVLKPRTALIESKIIDLPAPVSPLSTLKPFENSISALSIIAMFSIFKTESIK